MAKKKPVNVNATLCSSLDSRPQMTLEQAVTESCQNQILAAHDRLAKLAALPKEVREIQVRALHDVGHYF